MDTAIQWQILFYESKRGERPAEKFINKQQPQARAKIGHRVRLLRTYDPQLGMPYSKFLGEGLYELRIRGREELRILYCFKQQTIYLLHGFRKQKQETPQKEIQVAVQRMGELP